MTEKYVLQRQRDWNYNMVCKEQYNFQTLFYTLKRLFLQIRENHRQKEKAISDFQAFVARTSNYMLLQAAKQRQELSIDASRVQNSFSKMSVYN